MRFICAAAVFLIGSAPEAMGAPSSAPVVSGDWAPSIVIAVTGLGAINLSAFITPQRYERKIDCERDVRSAVATMQRLYPTLQIAFSACVK